MLIGQLNAGYYLPEMRIIEGVRRRRNPEDGSLLVGTWLLKQLLVCDSQLKIERTQNLWTWTSIR